MILDEIIKKQQMDGKKMTSKYSVFIILLLLCITLSIHEGCKSSQRKEVTHDDLELALNNPKEVKKMSLLSQRLQELPPEIGDFENLESLDLSYNKFKTLPSKIGNLKKLKKLNLDENRLNKLPPEIGLLNNLESLALIRNGLQELPPEIGNLSKLKTLYLAYNELNSLPIEIKKLSHLEVLALDYNPIPETEIKRIKKLLPNTKISY